jgi:hypothetical protein
VLGVNLRGFVITLRRRHRSAGLSASSSQPASSRTSRIAATERPFAAGRVPRAESVAWIRCRVFEARLANDEIPVWSDTELNGWLDCEACLS